MSKRIFNKFRRNIHDLDELTQEALFLAFRELVRPILSFLLSKRDWVEDATQDAFIQAMQYGCRMRDHSDTIAWLKKIARNSAYNILRRNKKYLLFSEFDLVHETANIRVRNEVSPDIPVDQLVEIRMRDDYLMEALDQLKWEDRVILYLRYMEGVSNKEAAKLLGVSNQVLNKRLERARKKLACLFVEKWDGGYAQDSKEI